MALAVIRGEYGNGEERKHCLGDKYAAVQAEVNRILSTGSDSAQPDLNSLADAVIRGDYGNGIERKRRLGDLYDRVQAVINQRYEV